MRRVLASLLLLLLAVGPIFAKEPPVVLSTFHGALVGQAPLTVRFRAAVQSDERNRSLCFNWVSDLSSGKSCVTMDGIASPLSYWKDITFRTGGEFSVSVQVGRNDGHTLLSNLVTIRVLSLGE